MKKLRNSNVVMVLVLFILLLVCLQASRLLTQGLPWSGYVLTVLSAVTITLVFWLADRLFFKVKPRLLSHDFSTTETVQALIPLGLYVLLLLATVLLAGKWENIGPALTIGVTAGVMEEFIVRGLMLGYFAKHHHGEGRELWKGLILSSLLFGLAHLNNLFSAQPLGYTLYQIVMATALGLFYGAIYLNTKSLLWTMLAHFMQDFAAIMISGLQYAEDFTVSYEGMLFWLVIYLGVALMLMRKSHLPRILEVFGQ